MIEDDVEIGVRSATDRATFGETRISRGIKIDSHVKIAHNCKAGEYCIIVAQTGLAGSSTPWKGVLRWLRSPALVNHARVGDEENSCRKGRHNR